MISVDSIIRRRLLLVCASFIMVLPPPASAHRCTGDCDGSDTITVNELVVGVRIALGQLPLDVCPQFDADLDNRVSIDELFVALNNVFSYCGHGSPPTPTSTRTPSRTPTQSPVREETPTATATDTPPSFTATATTTAAATETATSGIE